MNTFSNIKTASFSVTTREIRKSEDFSAILPAPAKYVHEREEDQSRFDSFVWSVQKLMTNYDDVVVLDVRNRDAYEKEHLPGAVNACWQAWSNVSVPQDSGSWATIDLAEVLAEKLAALGIDGKKPVVIYNDPMNGSGEEGRQLWTLRYYGLENTYILNGGIPAWKAVGGKMTSEASVITPTGKPVLLPVEGLYATTEYVSKHLESDHILDARSDQEYAGITVSGEKRNGRIPYAQHVWYKDLYHSDGTLLTAAEIRARVEPLGFAIDEPIIAYCTGGIRSAIMTMALHIAGYKYARNYNASFSGWTGTDQKIDTQIYDSLSVVNN